MQTDRLYVVQVAGGGKLCMMVLQAREQHARERVQVNHRETSGSFTIKQSKKRDTPNITHE